MTQGPLPGHARDGVHRLGRLLGGALSAVDRASFVVVIAGMGLMVTVIAVQVFLRYVLNESMSSASELARLSFVWVVFLALPHGIPRARHVAMDVVVTVMPDSLQDGLLRAMSLVAAVLMALVSIESWSAAKSSWDQLMPTLSFSYGWFYIALLISGLHALLHFLRLALLGRKGQEPPSLDEHGQTD